MTDKTVRIEAELTDEEAWQFAEYLKRIEYEDFHRKTPPHLQPEERAEQAYSMLSARLKIMQALTRAGYAPR